MGAKKNFLRWVVVGFERCLPTPPYIYFWNSPYMFENVDKFITMHPLFIE
jgi:hypothetical protein